ncbi:MAG TPA: hypothetical protein VI756_03940 [Blastocatellia bacterium]
MPCFLIATTATAWAQAPVDQQAPQNNSTPKVESAGSQAEAKSQDVHTTQPVQAAQSQTGQQAQASDATQATLNQAPAKASDAAQPTSTTQASGSAQADQPQKTQTSQVLDTPKTGQPEQASQSAQEAQPAQTGQPSQSAQPAQPGQSGQAGQPQQTPSGQDKASSPQTPGTQNPTSDAGNQAQDTTNQKKQTKRIFWIIPNNRAVSSDTQLPPLSAKGKLWLAAKDSFDYSSFFNVAILAAIGLAHNSTPDFHEGAAGYGRYFYHSWLDLADGNFMTEGVFPVLTHEDPRYYTLGHGSVLKRAGYAAGRIFVTRSDSGKTTFNISEISGNGVAAGISSLYYPPSYRNLPTIGKNWATQVGLDMLSYVFKEFWPDINRKLFGNRY